jgi:mono/diheme cytochrome c family protein
MPSYRDRLTERQRWAVVAYLRALELSQAAPLARLPARDQRQFLARGLP